MSATLQFSEPTPFADPSVSTPMLAAPPQIASQSRTSNLPPPTLPPFPPHDHLPHLEKTLPSLLDALNLAGPVADFVEPYWPQQYYNLIPANDLIMLPQICHKVFANNNKSNNASAKNDAKNDAPEKVATPISPSTLRTWVYKMLYNAALYNQHNNGGYVLLNIGRHILDYFNELYAEYIGEMVSSGDLGPRDAAWKASLDAYLGYTRADRFVALGEFALSVKFAAQTAGILRDIADTGDFTKDSGCYGDRDLSEGGIAIFRKEGSRPRVNWTGKETLQASVRALADELTTMVESAKAAKKGAAMIDLTFSSLRGKLTSISAGDGDGDSASASALGGVFDHALSVISLPMYEFQTRGSDVSPFWITPQGVSYARENKSRPFWTTMVIGGISKFDPIPQTSPFENHLLSKVNPRRIPYLTMNALEKQRKEKEAFLDKGIGGDVFWLVEFLQQHEVCYVKGDDVLDQPFVPIEAGQEGFFDPNYKLEVAKTGRPRKVRCSKGDVGKISAHLATARSEGILINEDIHWRRVEDTCGDAEVIEEEGSEAPTSAAAAAAAANAFLEVAQIGKEQEETNIKNNNPLINKTAEVGDEMGLFLLATNGHQINNFDSKVITLGNSAPTNNDMAIATMSPSSKLKLPASQRAKRPKKILSGSSANISHKTASSRSATQGSSSRSLTIHAKKRRALEKVNTYAIELAKLEMGKVAAFGHNPFTTGSGSGGLLGMSCAFSGVCRTDKEGREQMTYAGDLKRQRDRETSSSKRVELLKREILFYENMKRKAEEEAEREGKRQVWKVLDKKKRRKEKEKEKEKEVKEETKDVQQAQDVQQAAQDVQQAAQDVQQAAQDAMKVEEKLENSAIAPKPTTSTIPIAVAVAGGDETESDDEMKG